MPSKFCVFFVISVSCCFSVIIIIIIIVIAFKGAIWDFWQSPFKGAIWDFWQSPHSAVNCLQHARSSGPGASHVQHIERLSCASVMLRAIWYKGTAQLLSWTELKSCLFELYFIGWTIKRMKEGRKPLTTSFRKCHISGSGPGFAGPMAEGSTSDQVRCLFFHIFVLDRDWCLLAALWPRYMLVYLGEGSAQTIYVLPCWDRSCRSNLSHPDTVLWNSQPVEALALYRQATGRAVIGGPIFRSL